MKTRRKTVYLFVFEGYADWDCAYATVGIRKSMEYDLKTIAMRKDPITSMGGINTMPDVDFRPEVDLADIDSGNTAMLILPGGTAWEERANEAITPLVTHCLLNGIPVAAICGATLFLADLGILNRTAHTSNSLQYLESSSPAYRGVRFYSAEAAVRTEPIITASGASTVEFAREIFESLDIANEPAVEAWFSYMSPALV